MKKVSVFVVATVLLILFCYSDFALAQDEISVVEQEECMLGKLKHCASADLDDDGDDDFLIVVDGVVRYFQKLDIGDVVELPVGADPLMIPITVGTHPQLYLYDNNFDGKIDIHLHWEEPGPIYWSRVVYNTGTPTMPSFNGSSMFCNSSVENMVHATPNCTTTTLSVIGPGITSP